MGVVSHVLPRRKMVLCLSGITDSGDICGTFTRCGCGAWVEQFVSISHFPLISRGDQGKRATSADGALDMRLC